MSNVVEIYSVGDAAFLAEVLNSLAAISGSGNLDTVVGIGVLVGLILEGFRSILKNGEGIQFQNVLVVWIIYIGMFGGTKDVIIQDVYSSTPYPVDNVPQGIAFVGGMTSRLGVGITKLFEVGYSDVSMTEKGFGFASKALADVRRMSLTQSSLGSANSPQDGDNMWRSWDNYIQDCTMTGVDLDLYTVDQISSGKRAPGGNVLDQLRFDSNTYTTKIYINNAPNLGLMTCSAAFEELKDHSGTFQSALCNRLSQEFNMSTTSGPEACTDLNEAITTTLGQMTVDSQDYMMTTALAPIFEWAVVGQEVSSQRSAQAMMIHQSIQQRNDVWATEQTLFESTVRPMMTFFEGLLYAITPLMAFLIGLGPMGFKMLGKYLLMAIWIQLWLPVLSIVNLYLTTSIRGEMNALQATGQGDTSMATFYGIHSIDQTLQTWIATGGMLASSVPAITLMLVYGSAVTATSLAGKLGATASPEAASPDMVKNGAVMNNDGVFTQDRTAAATYAGSPSMQTKFGASTSWDETRQSAFNEMQSAQQSFGSALAMGVQSSGSMTQSGIESNMQKFGDTSSYTQSDKLAQTIGASLTDNYTSQTGNSISESMQTSLGAGVSAVAGQPGAQAAQANMAASYAQQMGLSESETEAFMKSVTGGIAGSEDEMAAYQQTVSQELSNGQSSVASEAFGWNESEQVTEANQELKGATESYSETDSLVQSLNANKSMTEAQAVKQVQNSPELSSSLDDMFRNHAGSGINREAESYAMDQAAAIGMSGDEALTAGRLYAMSLPQYNSDEGFSQDSRAFMGSLLGSMVSSDGSDISRNQGVSDGVAQETGSNIHAATDRIGNGTDGIKADATEHMNDTAVDEGAVAAHRETSQARLDSAGEDAARTQGRETSARVAEAAGGVLDSMNSSAPGALYNTAMDLIGAGTLASQSTEGLTEEAAQIDGMSFNDFNNLSPQEQREISEPIFEQSKAYFMEQGMQEDMASIAAIESTSNYLENNLDKDKVDGRHGSIGKEGIDDNVMRAMAPEHEIASSNLENQIGKESTEKFEDNIGGFVTSTSDFVQDSAIQAVSALNSEAINPISGENVSLGGVSMERDDIMERIQSNPEYSGVDSSERYQSLQEDREYSRDHSGVDSEKSFSGGLMSGFDGVYSRDFDEMSPEDRGAHVASAIDHAGSELESRGIPSEIAQEIAPNVAGQQLGSVVEGFYGKESLEGFQGMDHDDFNAASPEEKSQLVDSAISHARESMIADGISEEHADALAPYAVMQSPDSVATSGFLGSFGSADNEARQEVADIAASRAEPASFTAQYGQERGEEMDRMVADLMSKETPTMHEGLTDAIKASDAESRGNANSDFFESVVPGR